MDDLMSQFGEEFSPGGGGSKFKKALKPIDNGAIEVGIMTQMGDLRADPQGWRRFSRVHWGYSVRRRDDPTKTHKFTFECVRRTKNKMVVEPCPQCDKQDRQEEAKKAYEAQLRGQGKKEEEVRQLLGPLNSWLKTFNADNKWNMYAFQPSGEFNRLQLAYKTFQDLEIEMNRFESNFKLNPRSPRNLAMWRIIRNGSYKSGAPGSVLEKVEAVQEAVTVNGASYMKAKVIKLTDDQLRAALAGYVSLEDSGSYKLTYAQIKALAECNEDPEVVEKIINLPQHVPNVQAPPPSPASPATTASTTVGPAPSAPPITTVETKTETISTPLASMSEDELYASLGLNPADVGKAS